MDLIRCGRCAKQIPPSSSYCRRCGCPAANTGTAAAAPRPAGRRTSGVVALAVIGMSISLLLAGWINMSRAGLEAPYPVPATPAEIYATDDGAQVQPKAAPPHLRSP